MRGLKRNQKSTLIFAYQYDKRNKINKLSNFLTQIPTNFGFDHATLSKIAKISKLFSQGIGPKCLFLQNLHNSLNQFQFFKIKNRSLKKVMAIGNST